MSEFVILNKKYEKTLKQVIELADESGWVITPNMNKLNKSNLLILAQHGLVKNRGNILNTMITNKGRTYFEMKKIKLANDRRLNIWYQLVVHALCFIGGAFAGYIWFAVQQLLS